MIHFSHILKEASQQDVDKLLKKIKQREFRFFNKGDNGRIYEINDTDYLFKITTEIDEFKVANIIVNRYSEFTTFIPVYWTDNSRMYIMSKASSLPGNIRQKLENFFKSFKSWQREQGGERSVFEFSKTNISATTDMRIINFIGALESDVRKLNVPEFELDIDFRPDNIMMWNGNLVMIDW